eukprot:5076802-Pyramimonas_sp.AAC.1
MSAGMPPRPPRGARPAGRGGLVPGAAVALPHLRMAPTSEKNKKKHAEVVPSRCPRGVLGALYEGV